MHVEVEGQLRGCVLSLGVQDQTQVIRLVGKALLSIEPSCQPVCVFQLMAKLELVCKSRSFKGQHWYLYKKKKVFSTRL